VLALITSYINILSNVSSRNQICEFWTSAIGQLIDNNKVILSQASSPSPPLISEKLDVFDSCIEPFAIELNSLVSAGTSVNESEMNRFEWIPDDPNKFEAKDPSIIERTINILKNRKPDEDLIFRTINALKNRKPNENSKDSRSSYSEESSKEYSSIELAKTKSSDHIEPIGTYRYNNDTLIQAINDKSLAIALWQWPKIYFDEKFHRYNRRHEVIILQDRNLNIIRRRYNINPQVPDETVLLFSYSREYYLDCLANVVVTVDEQISLWLQSILIGIFVVVFQEYFFPT